MGEFHDVTCDSCGGPMVPNVSTLDEDGCGWICLSPGCPEPAAGELDTVVVSYHSGDFDEAEQARQTLAAAGALCAVLRLTAGTPGTGSPASSRSRQVSTLSVDCHSGTGTQRPSGSPHQRSTRSA